MIRLDAGTPYQRDMPCLMLHNIRGLNEHLGEYHFRSEESIAVVKGHFVLLLEGNGTSEES